MIVYQTGALFFGDRYVDIFLQPDVDIDSSLDFCLELEFTAFHYFAVKLVFSVESQYRDTLLFRSMTSLGDSLRLLKIDVRPQMTQHQRFFVVLHVSSSSIGRMAIIRRVTLRPHKCVQKGNEQLVM
jgi:hypothetical protein